MSHRTESLGGNSVTDCLFQSTTGAQDITEGIPRQWFKQHQRCAMQQPGPTAQVSGGIVAKALKARNKYWCAAEDGFMSRLQRFGICRQVTWALPQAVALRTFGADDHVDASPKLQNLICVPSPPLTPPKGRGTTGFAFAV